MKVGVQGLEGSFSELAAQYYLKKNQIQHYELDYLVNSHRALEAISQGQCELAIFAIENSTGGVVYETLYALSDYLCHIDEFFSIPITQNLLVKPGISKDKITAIRSHQQALSQCKGYLSQHFPGIPHIEAEDTAFAAKQLANNTLNANTGVIANQACAALYGLDILATEINDLKNNQTLFIAASPSRKR